MASLQGFTPNSSPLSGFSAMDPKQQYKKSMGATGSWDSPLSAGPTAPLPSPSPAKTNPKKDAYIGSLTSAAPDPYAALKTGLQGLSTSLSNFKATSPTDLRNPNAPVTQDNPRQRYEDAFGQYLSSLQQPDELTASSKRLADMKLLDEKQQSDALYAPGDTLAGANNEAANIARNNSFSISGEANRLSALTGAYNAKTGAAKARADFEKGLLENDQGQEKIKADQAFQDKKFNEDVRQYGLDYALKERELSEKSRQFNAELAQKKATTLPTGFSGTLSPLAQAVQNGTIALDKVPSAQRAQVAAELASSGIQSPRQVALQSYLDVADNLLAQDTDAITGLGQNPLNFVGISNQLAINQYDQLKGILSLENREKLKGSGAISDYESRLLADAASALGRNLSNKDFRTQLQKVRDVFAGKYSQTNALSGQQAPAGGTKVVAPDGQEVIIVD